jgi:transcriptional regulator with XRE-family HTH domain
MAQRETTAEERRGQKELIHHAAELLWAEMNRRELTKADIAAALGTSRPAVSMALNGEHNLTLRTLWDLAHAVGCRVRVDLVPEVVAIPLDRQPTTHGHGQDKSIVSVAA